MNRSIFCGFILCLMLAGTRFGFALVDPEPSFMLPLGWHWYLWVFRVEGGFWISLDNTKPHTRTCMHMIYSRHVKEQALSLEPLLVLTEGEDVNKKSWSSALSSDCWWFSYLLLLAVRHLVVNCTESRQQRIVKSTPFTEPKNETSALVRGINTNVL